MIWLKWKILFFSRMNNQAQYNCWNANSNWKKSWIYNFSKNRDYKIAQGDFKFSSIHSWFITRMLISRINFTAFFTWLVFSRYLNLGYFGPKVRITMLSFSLVYDLKRWKVFREYKKDASEILKKMRGWVDIVPLVILNNLSKSNTISLIVTRLAPKLPS